MKVKVETEKPIFIIKDKKSLLFNNRLFFDTFKKVFFKKSRLIGKFSSHSISIYHKKKLKNRDKKVNGTYVVYHDRNKKKFSYYIYLKIINGITKIIIERHNGKPKADYKVFNKWTLETVIGAVTTLIRDIKNRQ